MIRYVLWLVSCTHLWLLIFVLAFAFGPFYLGIFPANESKICHLRFWKSLDFHYGRSVPKWTEIFGAKKIKILHICHCIPFDNLQWIFLQFLWLRFGNPFWNSLWPQKWPKIAKREPLSFRLNFWDNTCWKWLGWLICCHVKPGIYRKCNHIVQIYVCICPWFHCMHCWDNWDNDLHPHNAFEEDPRTTQYHCLSPRVYALLKNSKKLNVNLINYSVGMLLQELINHSEN